MNIHAIISKILTLANQKDSDVIAPAAVLVYKYQFIT